MRQFVILGHDAPLDPAFSLDDLPGSAGRLDLLCRCVTSGLLQSHGVRDDSRVTTLHQEEFAISFDGKTVQYLNPDERSTAARFRSALETAQTAVGPIPLDVSPGITVARRDLATEIEDVEGQLVMLDPEGTPMTNLAPDASYTFVLSDHHSFSSEERDFLEAQGATRVSLGPVPLHADQAITVAHNYLDTAGYQTY